MIAYLVYEVNLLTQQFWDVGSAYWTIAATITDLSYSCRAGFYLLCAALMADERQLLCRVQADSFTLFQSKFQGLERSVQSGMAVSVLR